MEDMQGKELGRRLWKERKRLGLTQQQLADEIGYTALSINRWEHGKTAIKQDAIEELSKAFGKSLERWGIGYWHVPLLRNPYFTGREQTLLRLHKSLAAENTRAMDQTRAISGLGGIGKTQTALEYAYRYAGEYETVLWVQADSRETLLSSLIEVATALDLLKKGATDPAQVVEAVKRWLQEHGPWLMIFDNADDLNVVKEFLPHLPVGARLLTARTQITGMNITKIELEKLSLEETLSFLAQRSISSVEKDKEKDYLASLSETEMRAAQELWKAMDGLPLALDQAAAYIEATQCGFHGYLTVYSHQRKDMLEKRVNPVSAYPDSVATTWALSFEQVTRKNPRAIELLYLSAFLAPDAIPEELLTQQVAPLQDQVTSARTLNEAISVLLMYSLVRRDSKERTVSIHRLVQAVLQDTLDEATRQTWILQAMLALNEAFPEPPFKGWVRCEQLLPHVLVCANWIEREHLTTLETSFLFDRAGSYLRERGEYTEAEPLLKQAVAIREQHVEAEHLLASSLSNLAGLYSYQSKFIEAEQLVERALSIRKHVSGMEHPDTAASLSHLAILFTQQGKHRQAEPLYEESIAIYTQHLDTNQLEVARILSNFAVLHEDQGQYRRAEQEHRQAYAIYELQLEADHPALARSMGNLALVSLKLGKYEDAQRLYEQALLIEDSTTLDGAYLLFGLAEIFRKQGEFEQANIYYQQVRMIRDQQLPGDHPDRAEALQGLADLRRDQRRYAEAQELYQDALLIWEQLFGPESLQMTHALTGEAHLAREQGKYTEAAYLYQRAIHIRQHSTNPQHPDTAEAMYGLARLQDIQGNRKEARYWYRQALDIREQLLGVDHPETKETRTHLFALLPAAGDL